MNRFKTVTHAIAAAIATGAVSAATWVATNPEKVAELVKAYPKAAPAVGIVTAAAGLILALYHQPKEPRPLGNY